MGGWSVALLWGADFAQEAREMLSGAVLAELVPSAEFGPLNIPVLPISSLQQCSQLPSPPLSLGSLAILLCFV